MELILKSSKIVTFQQGATDVFESKSKPSFVTTSVAKLLTFRLPDFRSQNCVLFT